MRRCIEKFTVIAKTKNPLICAWYFVKKGFYNEKKNYFDYFSLLYGSFNNAFRDICCFTRDGGAFVGQYKYI